MRLWSLHPRYLDAKGLVALWREGLLARKVLAGATRGYRHHPQLERFRAHPDPFAAIETYLHGVYVEACQRGYRFNRNLIGTPGLDLPPIQVTDGQMCFERTHLSAKLKRRDPDALGGLESARPPIPHPLFVVVPGPIEPWERPGAP